MTGQDRFDSDATRGRDLGLETAIDLANALAITTPADPVCELRRVLAVDPPSLALLSETHVAPLVELAGRVTSICSGLIDGDVDRAAEQVNVMLGEHSAHPHLAHEDGRWRLHHHPADAELVPMWAAISADALARLIDSGRLDRLGRCVAPDCDRLFVDTSKNSSRRFCTTTCQNRVKAAAYRRRRQHGS